MFGIAALGTAIGERESVADAAPRYAADERKLKNWGIRGFHRAADGTGLTDLAVTAGRGALDRAGLAPESLDLVVLAATDLAEYLYWDPAAAVQGRLGAQRAEALLVNQACGSGVIAFDHIAGRFATHPEYRTALLIAANRVHEEHWNRMAATSSVTSDGAAAAVLVRGHTACRWLSTAVISDGRYADLMRLGFGADGAGPGRMADLPDRLEAFFGPDHRAMAEFADIVARRGTQVVDLACARAAVGREELRRVIHLNDNLSALADLAEDLGLPFESVNGEPAAEHGHFGCADQLFDLERTLAAGLLAAGDLVALTSTGAGMHWAATLLRV